MPEQNNNNDTGKLRSYQSIYVYDGNDPSQFKTRHAKVISHYATWLNGETQPDIRSSSSSTTAASSTPHREPSTTITSRFSSLTS